MYRSAEEVALLLATMLHRSGKTRARISEKTLRVISKRKTLRSAFTQQVTEWAEEFGVVMFVLERGGFALVMSSALEGAPPLLAKDLVAPEMKALRLGSLDKSKLYEELGFETPEDE